MGPQVCYAECVSWGMVGVGWAGLDGIEQATHKGKQARGQQAAAAAAAAAVVARRRRDTDPVKSRAAPAAPARTSTRRRSGPGGAGGGPRGDPGAAPRAAARPSRPSWVAARPAARPARSSTAGAWGARRPPLQDHETVMRVSGHVRTHLHALSPPRGRAPRGGRTPPRPVWGLAPTNGARRMIPLSPGGGEGARREEGEVRWLGRG